MEKDDLCFSNGNIIYWCFKSIRISIFILILIFVTCKCNLTGKNNDIGLRYCHCYCFISYDMICIHNMHTCFITFQSHKIWIVSNVLDEIFGKVSIVDDFKIKQHNLKHVFNPKHLYYGYHKNIIVQMYFLFLYVLKV